MTVKLGRLPVTPLPHFTDLLIIEESGANCEVPARSALKIFAKPTASSVVPAQAASLPEAASPAAASIAAASLEPEYCLELIAVRPGAALPAAASMFLVPLVLPAPASR